MDDRERIEHLATAVAWIRQEVVSVASTVHDGNMTSPTHEEGVATGSSGVVIIVTLLSMLCTPTHGGWRASSIANMVSDCIVCM